MVHESSRSLEGPLVPRQQAAYSLSRQQQQQVSKIDGPGHAVQCFCGSFMSESVLWASSAPPLPVSARLSPQSFRFQLQITSSLLNSGSHAREKLLFSLFFFFADVHSYVHMYRFTLNGDWP